MKLLLYMDAHINRPDKEGCTPLHWAAIRGKSEAAHVLAQAGGTKLLTAKDVEGQTAAQLANEKVGTSGSIIAFYSSQRGVEKP